MTLDANSSVTVLQNGPCLTQKTPSVSTIEASHDANRSVTVAKGLSHLDFMSVKVDFSVYKNIPSAFVTEDYTISHDLKDNNFCGSHQWCNLHVVMSVCQYVCSRG